MSEFRSTREVAGLLGMPPGRINRAIWESRLKPPQRGPSGAFLWSELDIRRASWVLLHRDLDIVMAERSSKGDAHDA